MEEKIETAFETVTIGARQGLLSQYHLPRNFLQNQRLPTAQHVCISIVLDTPPCFLSC